MTQVSITSLKYFPTEVIAKAFIERNFPKGEGGVLRIGNELKPSDLFVYLGVKYGKPNGIQNLFRADDSDNLIHWEWAFVHDKGMVTIMGLNLRTEVHFTGDWEFSSMDKDFFVNSIKSDLGQYGKQMSEFRRKYLEDWDVFVNPYILLRNSLDALQGELKGLSLDPSKDILPNPSNIDEFKEFGSKFTELGKRYDKGVGLAMAIRMMLPVLAESYINLLLLILCKEEIRANQRLYDAAVRSNIDIKVQSLSINCHGFETPVDWSSSQCREYNKIVNNRNDDLHGNVSPDRTKFMEIYFLGKVPVFKNYATIWQQSLGVSITASKIEEITQWVKIIDDFISYVKSCLKQDIREQVELFEKKRDLGIRKDSRRLGILLPDHLVDFGVSVVPKGG